MFEKLIKSFAEKENVTEKLKADKPMLWVQKMNNIRNRARKSRRELAGLYKGVKFFFFASEMLSS